MFSYLTFCFFRFKQTVVAPFLLHFGHIYWVNDLTQSFLNLTAGQFLFFFAIIFISLRILKKNSFLSSHRRSLFRYVKSIFNLNFFLTPVYAFFSSLKSAFLVFKDFIKKLKF